MFEELTFRNFLSFGADAEPVRLGRLNVIIGPNGSGKSNFLDGIGLLAGCPRKGALGRTLAAGGGVAAWFHHEAGPRGASLDAIILKDRTDFRLRHHLVIRERNAHPFVADEHIEAFPGSGNPVLAFSYAQGVATVDAPGGPRVIERRKGSQEDSILTQLVDQDAYPSLFEVTEAYEGVRLYRDWTFGRGGGIRRPGATDAATDHLLSDASNLAMVINGLKRGVRQQIVDRLQDLAPTFTGLETKVLASTIQLFLVEGDHEISALRLSDGTLRYLAMLVLFLHPDPPSVTVIEEPELGLHPDLLPGLAKLMVEASVRTQIIATTHSDIMVDALTEHPEAIRVCDKDESGTSIRPVDLESLKPWLEEHGMGGAWLRGAIGGSRW